MATQRTSRVVLNRKTINGIYLAAGDATFEVAKAVIAAARPPDDPRPKMKVVSRRTGKAYWTHLDTEGGGLHRGLVEGGGALAWVNRRKIAGTTIGGKQIKKPRRLRLDQDVLAIAGWGYPGHFVQWGTVKTPANPFFTRAIAEVLPKALGIARRTMSYRIARLR